MGTIGKFIGGILGFLVLIGVLKGVGDINFAAGAGIGDIALSIINGVADLTVKLIPTALDAIDSVV